MIETFVKEYTRTLREERRAAAARQDRAEARITGIDRKISRLMDLVEAGGDVKSAVERLRRLEAEKAALETKLPRVEAENVIAFHPDLHNQYRRQIERLASNLRGDPIASSEAREALRDVVSADHRRAAPRSW